MLYSSISDTNIADIVSAKLRSLRNVGAKLPKNKMSLEEWVKLFRKGDGKCFYSGQEFRDRNDVSFERLDPMLPYEKGNVVLVRREVNSIKSNIDKFLHSELSNEIQLRVLRLMVKVVERRIKKKCEEEAAAITAGALRAHRLSVMSTQMKRGRFSDNATDGEGIASGNTEPTD